jgi:hypothetical protein
MQIILTPEESKVLRTIGAKINGSLGGQAKSAKKLKASKRNASKARKAISAAA